MKKVPGSLISYMSNLVKSNGGINCAQGIPGFAPPDELLEELEKIVANKKCHQYAPGQGLGELREIISQNFSPGANLKRENVLITNGATEAISLIYLYIKSIVKTGINVLGFDPAYESHSNLPNIHGDKFINFTAEKTGCYNFELLERTIRSKKIRAVFLCSPGNPYGKIMSKKEIENIVNICKKNNCFIIFDAVYSDLYFDAPPFIPLLEPDKNIFVVSAFSKMLSVTGWRVGYLVAHTSHISKISDIHDYTGLSSPSVLQHAVFQYLSKHCYGSGYVKFLRKKIRTSFNLMSEQLVKLNFFVPDINGGYFIWAKLPSQFDNGFDFAVNLYNDQKVATVPGIHFSKKSSEWIRINIAKPETEITEAAKRIKNFIS